MGELIVNLLNSKKFVALSLAIVAALVAGFTGVQEWSIVITEIVAAIGVYMGSQGLADIGKERAKFETRWAQDIKSENGGGS